MSSQATKGCGVIPWVWIGLVVLLVVATACDGTAELSPPSDTSAATSTSEAHDGQTTSTAPAPTTSPEQVARSLPLREGSLEPSGFGVAWGWMKGAEGAVSGLFSTRDAGRTWADVTPAQGPGWSFVLDASFPDPDHGFAALNEPAVRGLFARTSDGGATWELLEEVVGQVHHAGSSVQLDFLDAEVGWRYRFVPAATECPVLLATSDGGQSWERRADCLPDQGRIDFVGPTEGWLGGQPFFRREPDSLHVTRDGGRTWQQVRVDLPEGRSAEAAFYHLPTWVGKEEGSLTVTLVDGPTKDVVFYRTEDGGRTWAQQAILTTEEPSPNLESPVIVPLDVLVATAQGDPETWWVGTDTPSGSRLLLTTDGGETWEARPGPEAGEIRWLQAVGTDVVWLGTGEATHATFNAGGSWARLSATRGS